jgi:hypothetical protein
VCADENRQTDLSLWQERIAVVESAHRPIVVVFIAMPTPEKVAAPYLPLKPPRKWVASKTGHFWQERVVKKATEKTTTESA